MTNRYGLMIGTLVIALVAALAVGGFVPALAQDGEDDLPGDRFPCPMWGLDPDDLPDDVPYGRGMMWHYYSGDELPEDWDAMPRGFGPGMLWGVDPDDLPEEWAEWFANMPETLPEDWEALPPGFGPGGGMMWYFYSGEELPEGYEDLPFGPGMMWRFDSEEMPEEWAEWLENCPMWDEDGPAAGFWGRPGGMHGRDMHGGRGPGMRR